MIWSPRSRHLRTMVSLLLAAVMLSVMMVGQAAADPPKADTSSAVGSLATVPRVLVDVYRFYSPRTGTHFYTASLDERNNVIATLQGVYVYEGVAYTLDTTAPSMDLPLYRFYNTETGTHFYTRSVDERDYVRSNIPQFTFEGTAYNVSGSPVDSTPVYRFFNGSTGGHFYTAGEDEKAAVIRSLPVFAYEGPAFYLATGDYTEPVITVTGVTDGGLYNVGLTPVITVTGATSQTITLNGSPFASGTAVTAEGVYSLIVSAEDAAGNTAETTVDFEIDKTGPEIVVTGVAGGGAYNTGVTPVITVTGATSQTITLNAAPFTSGTAITAEGSYTLAVSASDAAGNTATTSIAFEIDKTAPVINVTGVASNGLYRAAVTPTITVTGATSQTVTLNGAPFTSGTEVAAGGIYTLAVSASDAAGNTATTSIAFEIDTTAPVITVTGVAGNGLYNTSVTPVIAVTGATSQTITLNGAPYTSGTAVSGEGMYTVAVSASDAAGNTATTTVDFTIDLSRPDIVVTGVSDGGLYKTPMTPVITVYDATSQTITLNSTAFVSGTEVSAEGAYTLAVSASDAAGNTATTTIAFEIDMTAPVITVTGVADNGVYNTGVTPVITVTGATSQTITLNGVDFTSGTEVTADGTYTLAVSASDAAGNTATTTIAFEITSTLDAEIASAAFYVYDPPYTPVGARVFDDDSNTYTSTYSPATFNPGAMNDMARYLGALHYQAGSTVVSVTYGSVVYTWDPAEPNTGSNWYNGATSLVSAIVDDYTGGATGPVVLTLSDGLHTEDVTLTLVLNAVVTNQAELEAALANSQIDIITFGGSFTTDAQVHVMRDVTIDGALYTLGVSADLGTTNGSKHALSVEGAAAIITDLTIDSAGFAYGFNTYDEAVVTLENVSLLNSKGAGLTVNGSAVTASGLNTSGSAWGAINVDPGTGVTAESRLDLASGTLAEAVQIWSDKAAAGTPVVTVNAAGYTSLVTDTDVTVWSNRSYTVTATGNANGTVTPATSTVPFGTDVSITITPDAGYYLDELTLDGVPVAPQTPYLVPDVAADHAVVATFAPYAPVWTVEASPVLADVPTPGAWIKDRTAPAGFESADLEGENVLKLSVAAADYRSDNDWYNTTGRKYLLPNVQVVSADVYLPAEWATGSHRVGVWATAVDAASGITGYPIVDFFNDGTTATFRVWDNLGWHHVTTLVTYGEWYNFRIQRNANAVTYYIDGELVYESTFAADTDMATSVGFSEMILQGKNFNANDAVYFDNVVPVPNP